MIGQLEIEVEDNNSFVATMKTGRCMKYMPLMVDHSDINDYEVYLLPFL